MFLVNNYKQALHILDTKPSVIKALASLGATDAKKKKKKYCKDVASRRGGIPPWPIEGIGGGNFGDGIL